MPPSLRLNLLHDGQVTCLAETLVALPAFSGKLDDLCRELDVTALSTWFDTTDADADLDELDLLIDDGAHLASHGTWREASGLLATLQALHAELAARPRRFGLFSNKYALVQDELARGIAALQAAAVSGTALQAHLLVLR
ncbi:hypothetical protein [Megalodesulfovibrio gigas]|uniref:Uncharacterized protein n=1 Tax=Megalodesulfovibrio gigas (strain ATCC 19364 / DSM 1382 / NCIMB 9332 / VKM B-1759) TaxID=1121448 RepID=T2GDM9_MEGG1|nr:hypothetical protein [Megalodesulfovibrio gigas]AGW14413.1 hypothetical protein DGI_2682 [Megalodesulfovibrio gigas DSM 1382 = ATCC 19364]